MAHCVSGFDNLNGSSEIPPKLQLLSEKYFREKGLFSARSSDRTRDDLIQHDRVLWSFHTLV
ncbi:MAG TPA: hypothetical protein DCP63_12630 [Bacteroidetes bacterium]|nr:hypothetical protein [Bacteroidota bacterium]